jgi:hypothetical protein
MGVDTTGDDDLATDFATETPEDTGVDVTVDGMGIDTTGDDMVIDTTSDDTTETGEEENPDEPILKSVQKLTGKLAQKMRSGSEELESKDYKYVVNSILSAIDMTKISEEDMADMLSKLENKDSEDTEKAETEVETPEEPIQEQPLNYLKRIRKSTIDEFLNR